MKRVLVTGACGYLGARLSKYLAENKFSVTAFDNFNPSNYTEWFSMMDEVIIGDICDETVIDNLCKKRFDIVIHLISLDHHKSEQNPNFVSSINVMPTWNLLDKLSKRGLEKFIYFSTVQVYGSNKKSFISEETNPSPSNVYGLTHLMSEQICNFYSNKTDTYCINVRLSNSFGSPIFKENNCWWLVINDLCKTSFSKEYIKLFSDGSAQKDFIHVNDICSSIKCLINNPSTDKNCYHIATGQTYSILNIAYKIKKVYQIEFGKDIDIFYQDGSKVKKDQNYFDEEDHQFSTTNINNIGFKPKYTIELGIKEIFKYLKVS